MAHVATVARGETILRGHMHVLLPRPNCQTRTHTHTDTLRTNQRLVVTAEDAHVDCEPATAPSPIDRARQL
jgi:hypothetical protein